MTSESRASSPAKVFYRPVGRLSSVVAGVISDAVFARVWRRLEPGEHGVAPRALQSKYRLREIVVAAMLQGAIAGGVKALTARGGARVFQQFTGEWPGE
jgi:Protein of unknown function (DUF4235)